MKRLFLFGIMLFLLVFAVSTTNGNASPDMPTAEMDYFVYLPVILRSPPPPVVANGGFEEGRTGWAEYSAQGYTLILLESDLSVFAHTGSWAAWLGGADDEASIIEQTITIPTDRYVLNYWLWIASEDICGSDYDIGGVLINDTAVDAYYLCDPNNTFGWISRSIDLSTYAGQQVTLTFAAFTDFVFNSNLFIDDISIDAFAQSVQSPPQGVTPVAADLDNKSEQITDYEWRQPSSSLNRQRLEAFLNAQ